MLHKSADVQENDISAKHKNTTLTHSFFDTNKSANIIAEIEKVTLIIATSLSLTA